MTSVSTEAQQPIELVSVTPQATPDIFLLTYDSYVENETMLQYGIDNSPQESWLVENGFTLYPGTYSVAAGSIASMGRVLGGREPITLLRAATAGNSPFFKQLKLAGYDSYGIFTTDYFFQGVGGQYTYSFPPPASAAFSLAMAILEGEFRFNAHFDTPTQVEFERQKRAIMSRSGGPPKFLYTHTGPGHSQIFGACLTNEIDLFRQRLEVANQEMKTDITTVLAHHPQAIVIVNGDHGPYLTKTCLFIKDKEDVTALDIQDRFGTFLAIRWPDQTTQTPSEHIRLLQDLAPTLLNYIYPQHNFATYRVADELAERRLRIGGVNVVNGIIADGPDQGLPLFSGQQCSSK